MTLPRHDEFTIVRRMFEAACIAVAVLLLAAHLVRIGRVIELPWWWLAVVTLTGTVLADFVSGIIHWTADTWGNETMPVLGRRFLRPFRVHHINPDDFLRRRFLDTNGDVAMIVAVILSLAWLIPIRDEVTESLVVVIVSFCAAGLPTNQVHQWAHMSHPPRWVAWLQDRGVILSREAHHRHHQLPYAVNYCIATGWCNRCLTKVDFFRRLEKLVSTCTGLVPREDDTQFHVQVFQQSNQDQAAEHA